MHCQQKILEIEHYHGEQNEFVRSFLRRGSSCGQIIVFFEEKK